MRCAGIFILLSLLVTATTNSATGDPVRSPHHDGRWPGKQPLTTAHSAASSPRGMSASQKGTEPDRATVSGIGCNWTGWQYARSPRKCWNCLVSTETLRTLCSDGWVRRIEKVRVCIECTGGK